MAGRLKNPTHEKFAQLLALGHLSQSTAWLEAIGPTKAAKRTPRSIQSFCSRLASKDHMRARVDEIQHQNDLECRLSRRQLLDFYADVIETGAGDIKPDSRLCQSVERSTVEHLNSKDEVTRRVIKEKLSMPSKNEAAEGIRTMCGWDKKAIEEAPDDVSELLIMIRKRSTSSTLPDKPDSIQAPLELSSESVPLLTGSVRHSRPTP